ncbi:MAG: 4-alpha-glucanotransferase [Bacillota bacterium]
MNLGRKSGILLHPTSLPSKYGIGELGNEVYEFIDFLKESRQTLWQVLPLGPVGFGESPYQSFSAFAGNTLLISIDKLIEAGLLGYSDTQETPVFDIDKVEFCKVKKYKEKLLKRAYEGFLKSDLHEEYERFSGQNSFWLDDYALFMAVKEHFNNVAWNEWDADIAFRRPEAVEHYRKLLFRNIEYHKFLQYVFFLQWKNVKEYANSNGIKIIGDLPLFISNDSSDAWAKPELFEIDQSGVPLKVAGVPPDYFSETGQYWGNPHYRWDVMEKDDYSWWRDRFSLLFKMVDIIRIDHFRGFESYWEIPGNEKTAVNGKWIIGPGKKFFSTINKYLGDLPIIAEDLGFITREVEELKNEFGFPGMKILQFSFGRGSEERFLPHNYEENSIVYTGTHDNDTAVGWFNKSHKTQPEALEQMLKYLGVESSVSEKEFCWALIETAYKSRSNAAVIPLQDILCLDTDARMNIPSTIGGNWDWRVRKEMLSAEISEKLSLLAAKYNRN